MNQILITKKNNKTIYIYKFIFSFSIIFICFILFIFFKHFLSIRTDSNSSNSLSDAIKIQSLYNNELSKNNIYPIIGRIEIPNININYPIFSVTTDEFLKLGICKVYGPSINSSGNLCLAGHNYENHQFFSNLHILNLNDLIKIFDINNNSVTYSVYKSFEVENTNTTILEQNNFNRELTLITCNNLNKKRLIIKAKEIE